MNKFETYWDNFNTELYALVRQVKKQNIIHHTSSSCQDGPGIYLN
jgi:hypothetical protein